MQKKKKKKKKKTDFPVLGKFLFRGKKWYNYKLVSVHGNRTVKASSHSSKCAKFVTFNALNNADCFGKTKKGPFLTCFSSGVEKIVEMKISQLLRSFDTPWHTWAEVISPMRPYHNDFWRHDQGRWLMLILELNGRTAACVWLSSWFVAGVKHVARSYPRCIWHVRWFCWSVGVSI